MNKGRFYSQNLTIDNLITAEIQHLNRIKDMCLISKDQLRSCQDMEHLSSDKAIRPTIKEVITQWQYPLYLIDIQLYERSAADSFGIGDCEVVAISCSSLNVFGETTKVNTWICDGDFLNSEQVLISLKDTIGTTGTPLIWTSTITDYLSTLNTRSHRKDTSLLVWAEEMTDKMIDLNALLLNFYLAPGLSVSQDFPRNLDMLDRTFKKKHTLNELYNLIDLNEGSGNEVPTHEMKQLTEALFKYDHTRFSMYQTSEDGCDIQPFLEQYLFGSPKNRKALANKICEYSQIQTNKIAEWYKYWLSGKQD